MSELEQLREALASAQQLAAAREARLRQQDLVLNGLRAIQADDEPSEAIARAFDLLRAALDFELALALAPKGGGYVCTASTDPALIGRTWPGGAFFGRVAGGDGAVTPDGARVPDWRGGDWTPPQASAIFAPLSTGEGPGLLVLFSDRRGAYAAFDLTLVTKLGLVVSQALAAWRRKRLAEEIRRAEVAREAAVRANEVKSRFFANMSHEIRTPLNGVLAVAEVLARRDLAGREAEMVGIILKSGRMLEGLLNDILDFTKIEANRLELDARPCDLRADLSAAIELFTARADERGLWLRMTDAEVLEQWYEADSLRVRQVVTNLLSNAVKFTESGGVEVAFAVEPGAEADTIRVRVRDTGCGFSPEAAERLFDRFEQEDSSITRRFGGAGLGLSISRSLARLMGGDIRCESVPGEGALFEFSFKARRAEAPDRRAPEAEAQVGAALRILVAEDNPTNQRILKLILETAGLQAAFVENGEAACDAVRAQAFDIVLMDLQMPVMDGLTAIRRIRERERRLGGPPLPILAVSANAMAHQVEEALEAGADAHAAKPINPQALLGTIARLCAPRPAEAGEACAKATGA